MPQWNEMQERARRLIEEGLQLLKSGAHEAGFIAETTASAARLHMVVRQNQFEKYKLLHDLGEALYKKCPRGRVARTIDLSDGMISMIDRAGHMDDAMHAAEVKLSKFSIVRKGAAQRAGARQRTAKDAGAGTRKPRPRRHRPGSAA